MCSRPLGCAGDKEEKKKKKTHTHSQKPNEEVREREEGWEGECATEWRGSQRARWKHDRLLRLSHVHAHAHTKSSVNDITIRVAEGREEDEKVTSDNHNSKKAHQTSTQE